MFKVKATIDRKKKGGLPLCKLIVEDDDTMQRCRDVADKFELKLSRIGIVKSKASKMCGWIIMSAGHDEDKFVNMLVLLATYALLDQSDVVDARTPRRLTIDATPDPRQLAADFLRSKQNQDGSVTLTAAEANDLVYVIEEGKEPTRPFTPEELRDLRVSIDKFKKMRGSGFTTKGALDIIDRLLTEIESDVSNAVERGTSVWREWAAERTSATGQLGSARLRDLLDAKLDRLSKYDAAFKDAVQLMQKGIKQIYADDGMGDGMGGNTAACNRKVAEAHKLIADLEETRWA